MVVAETSTGVESVKFWLLELEEAKRRDSSYRSEGKRIISIYEATDEKKVPFNILYSNTDTLLPALYSSVPRPVIRPRFKDLQTPLAQAAAKAGEKMLEYLLDTNIEGYETFHEAAEAAVIDALLPGRGVTRIKYDAEIGEYPSEDSEEPMMSKESESVCTDSIIWDRVLFGYAKKWSKMPWVAFEEVIDKAEAVRLFGEEIAAKIEFTKGDDSDEDGKESEDKNENKGGAKTAVIYQIWDKDNGRKVRYVSTHYRDGFLKVEDDPLELAGFYPIPKPLELVAKSHDLKVTAPYHLYEQQAKEINELTARIQRLTKAIKAKFVYDSELGSDIQNLINGDDMEGIPADKSAAISSDGGFEKSMWFMPLDMLIRTLRELYAAREEAKQVIYEVTGISDIIRGSTVASETATAQNIKSQWGTMRLKRSQGEVQRYCRDMLRIMLEIAATKFSEQTWSDMTGLPFATEQEYMQSQQIIQAAQQISAQYAGNPQPPEIPQQMLQTLRQAQETMQKPQWSQVLELLRNDMQRSYQIDIETNSTVVPEAVEDQKNIAEVMTALGQYLQGINPLVQEGVFPFEAAQAMMIAVVRRYQFGAEIEDYIKKMKPPAPPPDNSQAEMQAKAQEKQLDMQAKQQESQQQAALKQQEMENQRLIEQGKASTQMHIEQMRIEAEQAREQARIESEKALEVLRIESMERLEIMKMQIERETQFLLADKQAELSSREETEETEKEESQPMNINVQVGGRKTIRVERDQSGRIIGATSVETE